MIHDMVWVAVNPTLLKRGSRRRIIVNKKKARQKQKGSESLLIHSQHFP